MAKKVKILYFSYNIARILFAVILLLSFLSDIHGIAVDPNTYEKVYTGEFLGADRYESLLQLKVSLWRNISICIVYIFLVILHLTKFKQYKIFTWFLRVVDVFVIIFIGYSLYKVYFL